MTFPYQGCNEDGRQFLEDDFLVGIENMVTAIIAKFEVHTDFYFKE